MHAWALFRPFIRGRRLAAAATAVGLSTAGLIGFAGVASAHANQISGAVTCQADGTYTVTWTVGNDYNLTESVTYVSHTGGGVIGGLPTTIPASSKQPYKTATVTQSGIPGTATAASLKVTGTWSDGYSRTDSGQVTMNGRCVAPPTYTAPTFVDATCVASGSYTIPAASKGYYYQVDLGGGWTTVSAGTVNAAAGATVKVRLMKSGRPDTQVGSWSHTFTAPADCTTHVTPVAPTLTQSFCDGATPTVGHITIPTTTGVVYEENGNPVSGDITTPGTYTITAVAKPGYTLDGVTSWTLAIDAAPTCTQQQPSLTVTGTCDSVTYTFTNDTVTIGAAARPAVVLGTQPAGPVTFDIYKSTDGGATYTKVDSVTVQPGSSASKTEHGAGMYRVQIGNDVQGGSAYTVSGNCPVPLPVVVPVLSVSGSVTSTCPAKQGQAGSYVVTVTNEAASTQSVRVRVSDGAKVVGTSGDLTAGQSYSYTGPLAAGQGAALKAEYSVDGGATWTPVTLSGKATIVCPTVLAEQFTQPPAVTPTSTPTQTLPFTGLPTVPTVLLALGLILGGTLMVMVARRGRDKGELLNG